MNWELTHLAMAPRADRVVELRNEASAHRRSRDLNKQEASRSSGTRRVGFVRVPECLQMDTI